MIRIFTTDGPSAITMTLDGRLVGEYVAEVEASVRHAIEQGKKVRLFLRHVFDIDDTGRSLLSRLASEGVQLTATGVYSSYVVANLGK